MSFFVFSIIDFLVIFIPITYVVYEYNPLKEIKFYRKTPPFVCFGVTIPTNTKFYVVKIIMEMFHATIIKPYFHTVSKHASSLASSALKIG
jgi:hypothetical protein